MLWGSLLGLGVSAAVYGLSKNRNNTRFQPLQNLMNNSRMRTNMAGLTEFAKEFVPNKTPLKNK